MRLPILAISILVVLNVLIDWYIYRQIKRKSLRILHLLVSALLLVLIIVAVALPRRSIDNEGLVTIMWMLYWYFSVYIPKYLGMIFHGLAQMPRLFHRKSLRALNYVGIVLSVGLFLSLVHGALVNSRQFIINHVDITLERLPKSFDGYRMVQFSDLHTGTYGSDTTFVAEVVDSINALRPDIILFTGDIVNRNTEELRPFLQTLSRLHSPGGVYSILGNHDYGDYMDWPTSSDKERNMQLLYKWQADMGWKMLNNSSTYLHNATDSIALIGVENWGAPPFPKYGDLNKAYPNGLCDGVCKILMSHNPAHWTAEVTKYSNIDLTLSGHTHAMQMAIWLFGEMYSPSVWRYKQWGGLYTEDEEKESPQQIYVNIGLGEVGFPARILAATPEITLITLHSKK